MALPLLPALPVLPSSLNRRRRPPSAVFSSAAEASEQRSGSQPSNSSVQQRLQTRASLVLALASQSFSVSQKVLTETVSEISKYVFPKSFEARNLEEALMSVPDLETVKYKVLKRTDQYEIREVEPYFVAETKMPGNSGFDLYASSRSFNVLAAYLFGENTKSEEMKMTTPVYTRKADESPTERMDMTTPVITKRSGSDKNWRMSFIMPSKYGPDLPLPKDPSVKIQQIPRKTVAVAAFAGYVTDKEIGRRESKLREAVRSDREFQLKPDALAEVAQYNPPFTLPFMRRNEISLEVLNKIA